MLQKIRRFFFPAPGASRFIRVLPYLVLGAVTLVLFTAGTYAWDYTNSPVFCGTTCHTMPPEYAAYQVSPHARVDCVECHIGRDIIATKVSRKAGDLEHVFDTIFNNYTYPIFAGKLRPSRETCERCHYPAKFSDDSLIQKVSYLNDEANTRSSLYLEMRTGGGTKRQGLGKGIHWHVENQVWFAATDKLQQDIPYVKVIDDQGATTEYVSLSAGKSKDELASLPLQQMDCITCHNRISHSILPPDEAVDKAIASKQIDQSIPFIRKNAVEVLSANYTTDAEALKAIDGLSQLYATKYADYAKANPDTLKAAVDALKAIYSDTNFRDQKADWKAHPNNLGHKNWPGCWRCHDGQHVTEAGQAIRLECNVCHSIPVVAEPDVIEPKLPLATGKQPESHFNTLWIAMHNKSVDASCAACHTVEDAGGTTNKSFCSNSVCHGAKWQFAGLDAPGLAKILDAQRPAPAATPIPAPVTGGRPTFDGQIGPLFASMCLTCHSKALATSGLVLETYDSVMKGGATGPVIIPGDPDKSQVIIKQKAGHFATLSPEQLQMVIDWIKAGAPKN